MNLPPFGLVAEIGPAEGDLAYALEAVREASRAGVWAVKAQFYEAQSLASPDAEPYWKAEGKQRDHLNRQLTDGEWGVVAEACDRAGLVFFASVFDRKALALAQTLDCPYIKIASGDITNRPLLEAVRETGKPVLLSCGASFEHEIRRALCWLDPSPVLPMACSLEYPTPPSRAHLGRIPMMAEMFGPVGYSNHVPGIGASIAAKRLGACLVETHFTITPGAGGDHDFAVTTDQILDADWDREPFGAEQMVGHPRLLGPHEGERAARLGARRSLHAACSISEGEPFTPDNLIALRPMPGWEPWQIDSLLGSRARRGYDGGERIAFTEGPT
jgi:sialic acid synthase SpsE